MSAENQSQGEVLNLNIFCETKTGKTEGVIITREHYSQYKFKHSQIRQLEGPTYSFLSCPRCSKELRVQVESEKHNKWLTGYFKALTVLSVTGGLVVFLLGKVWYWALFILAVMLLLISFVSFDVHIDEKLTPGASHRAEIIQ